MANKKTAAALSLDNALQESRKDRNAKLAQQMLGTNPQKLAQEILGKNRRTSTPRAAPSGPSSTLASRMGVTKRSSSLPRSHTAPPRNPRQPSHLGKAPNVDTNRPREIIDIASSDPASDVKSNGHAGHAATNGGSGLNIRGAAGGPYIVRASNFAPGTTAADIEQVMAEVGGKMAYCKLVASAPTVIAEMSFMDRTGAEAVIEMFNNKKADGRLLYVYYADGTVPSQPQRPRTTQQPLVEEAPLAVVDTIGDDTMELDEHAHSREVQNRQREERRGRDDRGGRDAYTAPRYDRDDRNGPTDGDDYYRSQRRPEPMHQDSRYGYGGGRGGYGGGRGGYRDEGRMYSDRMGRGGGRGGGQGYRP